MSNLNNSEKKIFLIVILVFFLSILVSQLLQHYIKLVVEYGTKKWTGKKAAVAFLRENNALNKIEIVDDVNTVFDRYDIVKNKLYISSLSANSYNLYNYLNALRQSVIAVYATEHRKKYALRAAISMVCRFSGPTSLLLIILFYKFNNPFFLYVAGGELILFVLYETFNSLVEKYISDKIINFTVNNSILGKEELKVAKKYNIAVDLAEFSTVWNGTANIIMLVPKIIIDLLKGKAKQYDDYGLKQ